jgi:hypothetical protein
MPSKSTRRTREPSRRRDDSAGVAQRAVSCFTIAFLSTFPTAVVGKVGIGTSMSGRVGGHAALVEKAIQFGQRHRRSGENNGHADLFAKIIIR